MVGVAYSVKVQHCFDIYGIKYYRTLTRNLFLHFATHSCTGKQLNICIQFCTTQILRILYGISSNNIHS